MTYNFVTVKGTFQDGSGNALQGRVSFSPTSQIIDSTNHAIISPDTISVVLDSTGSFSLSLLAMDNTGLATGWAWLYIPSVSGIDTTPQTIGVNYATGATQWIDTLPEVSLANNYVQFALSSAVTAETSRAEAAEALLATVSALTAEANTRSTAVTTLQTNITAEQNRALAAEAVLLSDISSSGRPARQSVQTANYTVTANTLSYTDTSSGSLTATLPTSPADQTWVFLKQVNVAGVGTNATTIACGGSDVFNRAGGSTSMTLTLKNQSLFLQYDATLHAWIKVASDDATGDMAISRDAVYYLDSYTGTDDQKMTTALAAAVAAGGGIIKLSPRAHVFAGQWATSYVSNAGSVQIHITAASKGHGASEGLPVGTTTCDMQYASTGAACMDFQHSGSIEIDHLMFINSTGTTVPFFQTTNAEPNLHDLTFVGHNTGTACNQDVIYLGGTTTTTYTGGDTGAFQAYQGVIQRINFYGIRTGVWARTYANSISMRDLMFDGFCGSANVFAVADGNITAGATTLTTTASTPFTAGMVTSGQIVVIAGAGADSQNKLYVGRITGFTSSSSVTVSAAAVYTVANAALTAPGQSAIMIGSNAASGGVEGVVINDCCMELNNYPVGITLTQSSGNAILGTSFWDGGASNLASVVEVQNSNQNTYIVPENNQVAGVPAVVAETVGTATILAPSLGYPQMQLVGPIAFNANSGYLDFHIPAASGIRFSSVKYQAPTLTLVSDAAGNADWTMVSGSTFKVVGADNTVNGHFGPATNYVSIGGASTVDAWVLPGGTNTTINLQLSAQGANGYISLRKHSCWVSLAGTPTIVANANAGTAPTVSVVGNDMRGVITVTTGTGSVAAGNLAAITFNASWASSGQPYMTICASNAAALALGAVGITAQSTTAFTIACQNAPALSTTYTFNYVVMG